jgi:hypothetical protein
MTHQSESGRNLNERKEHDRKARFYESTTGNPYHLSSVGRVVVAIVIVVVLIALTWFFIGGWQTGVR